MIEDYKHFDLFGKTVFERMVVRPPYSKLNSMSDEACFLHIIEGNSLTHSEMDTISLHANDSLLMKCGNYVSHMLPSKSGSYFHSYAVHFHLEVLKEIYQNELPTFLSTHDSSRIKSFVRFDSHSLVNHYMEGIKLYFQYPSNAISQDLLILKLKELLLLLAQYDQSDAVRAIMASLFSPVTYSMRQVIDAHLYTTISIAHLAGLCGMSLSTFKREFKKRYQLPPAIYLKNKKLEKAREFLSLPEMRINEIAYECGFNDVSHFSKSFTLQYGLNPTAYRLSQIH